MIIAVLGGGNIGTTLSGYLSHLERENEVRLYTSKPELFQRDFVVNDIEKNIRYTADVAMISNNLEEVVSGADVVFITFPHFMLERTLADMRPYVKTGCMVGVLPGSGGCEFIWKKYYDESYTLFGFQRVPFIARMVRRGKETDLKSWKPYVVVASIPGRCNEAVCDMIERECMIPCEKADNYLAITLTPSNPLLHSCRIYDIFKDTDTKTCFPELGMFYKEWTDYASHILFEMDKELHEMLKRFPKLDLSLIRPLAVHYESPTIEAMTRKISSIPSFSNISSPLKKEGEGYVADTASRFFVEDFPYGLCIVRGFCEIGKVEAPYIDRVLKWYGEFMNVQYYEQDEFVGKDLINTGIPQNYGLHTVQDVYDFYL